MGPSGLLITGFFLIPFDLVARDALHERWKRGRFLKMASLILGGSLLAWITNPATIDISRASAFSFLLAGSIDWSAYSLFKNHSRMIRMNVSNLASSIADSIFFQIIAFGTFSLALSASQSMIKIVGAFLWTLLLVKVLDKMQSKKR
jgi:hypothetical protein